MAKYLVAARLIGSHIVDALLQRGSRSGYSTIWSREAENLAHCLERIEFIEGHS
jgi:hypothetical protein